MKPNSIFGRYLMKRILFSFLGVLSVALGIIFICQMIELLRRAADRPQIGFWFLVQMAVAKLPETLDIIFPFVMMIAAMISFWQLSKSNEFVIIRAAGVSIWGFLTPVLAATFLIGIVNITVVNPISARLYEAYENLNYRFKTQNMNKVVYSDKGLWTRESIENGNIMIIQAKTLSQEKENMLMRNVSILELDKNSRIIKSTEAFAGILNNNHELELKDAHIYETGKQTQTLGSTTYHTALSPSRIKETFVMPEAISFWSLPGTINFYERSGFAVVKHKMHYLSLLALPFTLMSMILVAAVFALKPNQRRGGILYLIVGGIITGFLVYFLSQIIFAFGLNGYLPEGMAVWTPIIITTCLSVTFLLQTEDG